MDKIPYLQGTKPYLGIWEIWDIQPLFFDLVIMQWWHHHDVIFYYEIRLYSCFLVNHTDLVKKYEYLMKSVFGLKPHARNSLSNMPPCSLKYQDNEPADELFECVYHFAGLTLKGLITTLVLLFLVDNI